MTLTTKTYPVNNPAAFHGLWLKLPANSLVFLCAAGQPGLPSPPPGVLLIPGFHIIVSNGQFFIMPEIALNIGDLVQVVTFLP